MLHPGQDLCYVYNVDVILKESRGPLARENPCLVNPIPTSKNAFCMLQTCYGGAVENEH